VSRSSASVRARLASGVGHVGRRLRAQRAGEQPLVEQRRERAEADQRAGGPVGRDEQRQPGVQALQLARLEDHRDHGLIVRTLDARGLICPLPLIHARRELAGLREGETLVVLATDPEAPIDLAALAADEGHAFAREQHGDEWRITLTKGAAGR
jgi:tRNA 2-thiouridine synthesizing protein A